MRLGLAAAFAALVVIFAGAAAAQSDLKAAPVVKVESQTLPDPVSPQAGFDAMKATNAYLGQLKGEARKKSDSYFEGGYVLLLVDALYAVVVSAILLWSRISAGIRNYAQRWTRSRFWQVPIYVIIYTLLVAVLTFPLTVYEDFFREHQYGLSNQNFMQWFGDFGTLFGVNLLATTILLTVIYAVIRGAPRTWWLWGTLVTVAFLMLGATIAPVYVAPLINHYQPLKEGPLKERILSLARAEGVPATNVYEFDASKQTKRVSANVSGMFGTTRISMNDNLLKRTTPDMVVAVLGHEMGHYVLNHITIGITWFGLVFFVGFAFVNWGFRFLAGIFGGNWDVRTIDDPAGLPLIMALATIFLFLATPVTNTITRTTEAQADIFGINAVRQPDAFAKSALMLAEYRKLDPSPWEEFVFFDHPSGRTRIYTAMRWKAEHLNDPDIKNGPVSPQ
ncbi:MAG TPA: M48 family metallopeptidase [Rhizomicrobium sp.]|nr:M48 family metallopeptidase [Rhizomicrobium sp.]